MASISKTSTITKGPYCRHRLRGEKTIRKKSETRSGHHGWEKRRTEIFKEERNERTEEIREGIKIGR